MDKLTVQAKKVIEKAQLVRFQIIQSASARKTLSQIEAQKGKTSQALIRKCDEYAVETFGSKIYAPWLYVYSSLTGVFKEGWIPDNYFNRYVVSMLQGAYGKVSFLKPLTRKIFQSDLFPDLGAYVNGLWFSTDGQVLREEQIAEYLFRNDEKIVFKADENAFQGLGVYFFTKNDFDTKRIRSIGNGVFQGFIKQHPFFEEIVPGSVATIRLTTVTDNSGEVSLRSAILRVGRTAESHVKAKTEIRATIDVKTGKVDPTVYLPNFHVVSSHPDTGYVFGGKQIPSYHKLVDAVTMLHAMIPEVRCIGWDVVVDDKDAVKIMEWNGAYTGVKLAEAIQGPCFAGLGWDRLHLAKEQLSLVY